MTIALVSLGYMPGGPWVALREIEGLDEAAVGGNDAAAAILLLDRLFVPGPGARIPEDGAIGLAVSDRDRLLAHVYTRVYGARVESTVHCRRCHQPYDLDFSLDEVQEAHEQEARDASVLREDDGTFVAPGAGRFRLPTGLDERAVRGLSPANAATALIERCVIERASGQDGDDALQLAMEVVGPMLDLTLPAACPECGANQSVRFDIQSYLLNTLLQERPRLVRDVHLLATIYGWSRADILSLPRTERRAYTALIESGVAAGTRWSA